jgi:hypothetical protein
VQKRDKAHSLWTHGDVIVYNIKSGMKSCDRKMLPKRMALKLTFKLVNTKLARAILNFANSPMNLIFLIFVSMFI